MGILSVLKKVGSTSLDVLDVADDVLSHPAVMPLTLAVPWGWALTGMKVVRKVNGIAQDLRDKHDVEMPDEDKRREFAEMFRKAHPEATDSDISALAALLVKVQKGETITE